MKPDSRPSLSPADDPFSPPRRRENMLTQTPTPLRSMQHLFAGRGRNRCCMVSRVRGTGAGASCVGRPETIQFGRGRSPPCTLSLTVQGKPQGAKLDQITDTPLCSVYIKFQGVAGIKHSRKCRQVANWGFRLAVSELTGSDQNLYSNTSYKFI